MSRQEEQRVGQVIAGKWRVDALLGSGSMAAVYAVTHRNGARAALKILHPNLCADRAVCERFLGEGYLTNAVKHPGIVRVLDDGVTDDGCVFLVMDLLEGLTLEGLRQERGGQIDYREMLDIADKLMDVLEAVHAAGIIHRDLKPQNVFVCNDGSVKLLDFGVARVLDQGAQSKLSVFGLVLGTPSFMSPEQALGARDRVDHRTDIWSLGATLFTALTGQTVHLGPNAQARLLAAAKQNARSIALVKQDLPSSIAAAIDMALRYKKEDRWQTVEAFRRAFRDARAELGLGAPESAPVPAWLHSQENPALPAELAQPKDQGERALALMVKSNREEKRAKGTLQGIGPRRDVEGEAGFGSTTVRMPRPTQPSIPEADGPPAYGMRPPMTSAAEGSYPAAYSTLEAVDSRGPGAHHDPTDPAGRASTLGFWIAALALVGLGGSGAFFAVNRANAKNSQNATTAPPTVTIATSAPSAATSAAPGGPVSAVAAPPPPASATAALSLDAEPRTDASTAPDAKADAGVKPSAPAITAAGARTPRAAPPGPRPPARNPSSTRPQDQVLPPDPFGTPD